MGAMLAGALGSPLTAIVFSIELTHALPALLPLIVACIAAYTITSLIMPRSILTEKLGRRGHHLTREYGVDPLEMVSVEDAMTDVADEHAAPVAELPAVYTFSDETCRSAAERMATTGQIRLAVVDRETMQPLGYVSLQDLLIGRRRFVEREEARERVFRLAASRTHRTQDPVVTREERATIQSNTRNAKRIVISTERSLTNSSSRPERSEVERSAVSTDEVTRKLPT